MSTIDQNARRNQIIAEGILADTDFDTDIQATVAEMLTVAKSLRAQNVIMLIGTHDRPNAPEPDRWPRWARAYLPAGWGGANPTLQFRCSTVGVAETVRCTFLAHGVDVVATAGCLVTISL